MWRTVAGIALTSLPRRWRVPALLEHAIPWQRSAILSGILESLLALIALIYWYSHSVTTWAAEALDSALRNGPGAGYDPHLLGLSAFVIWCIHPFTWLLASLFIEGLARIVAAISTEQILPLWPLAFSDWLYGKVTHRAPEGDSLHLPTARAQLHSFASTVKQAVQIARLPDVADELIASDDAGSLLEIHSSRPKPGWVPPRVIRVADAYYRLEATAHGRAPRPFIFYLRRLSAGVPGRTVLLYEPPPRHPTGAGKG